MKLYVTDLDGTLLDDKAELSDYTRNELNRLLETKKITFFTARSYSVAERILEGVKWKLPCAVNNGAFIIDSKTGYIIEGFYLDNDIVNSILAVAEKLDLSCILLCMYKNEEKMIYSNLNNEGIYEYIRQRKNKKDDRLFEWKDKLNFEMVQVFSLQFVDSYDKLKKLQNKIEKYNVMTYLDREIYVEGYYYLNINSKEATKENALLKIINLLGVSMKDVTVFGDQINDLKMLQMAGTGVAVDNANEDLKKVADKIIGSNKENSVVKYISEQLENH